MDEENSTDYHKIPQNNLLFQSKSGTYEEIANDVIFGLINSSNETKKTVTNNEIKNTITSPEKSAKKPKSSKLSRRNTKSQILL